MINLKYDPHAAPRCPKWGENKVSNISFTYLLQDMRFYLDIVERLGNIFISSARQQVRRTHTFWITTWNLPWKTKNWKKGVILYNTHELFEFVCRFNLQNPKIGLFSPLGSTILILILIPVETGIVVQLSTFLVHHKLLEQIICLSTTRWCCRQLLVYLKRHQLVQMLRALILWTGPV